MIRIVFLFLWALLQSVLADGSGVSGMASLTPPYTCTTTVCQPGESGGFSVSGVNRGPVQQGRTGKRGAAGPPGPKGEQGDPCQCDIADEAEVARMKTKVEEVEAQYQEINETMSNIKRLTNIASSCLQWKQEGQTESGIYRIMPNNKSNEFEVFCDMESAGGGWTMVASIHENNFNGKCTSGDLWSSDQGTTSEDYIGTKNWKNFNTFGSVDAATSADYKSKAYNNLQASDVMIWHVPNDIAIEEASVRATLKYYTDSSFLNKYGGSLRTLFRDHYPLVKKNPQRSFYGRVRDLIVALNSSAPLIRNTISGFYNYAYDGGDVYISDGGSDMFDGGNKISYQIGSNPVTKIRYNINYKNATPGVDILSATSYPFNVLMWIDNEDRRVSSFALKADQGDAGADGSGSYNSKSGTLTSGSSTLKYHAFNVYGTSDSSICKVFYYIYNTALWNSVAPSASRTPWSSGTSSLNHGLILSGSPKSILVGYTLLSKSSGVEVSNSQIQAALNKILAVIMGSTATTSCDRTSDSLIEPVRYLTGNDDQITRAVPSAAKVGTVPGFIQFRAFDDDGFPYPMCPGVKTKACKCRSVCVGGINTSNDELDSCGDFGDENLARSSILIFTRNSP